MIEYLNNKPMRFNELSLKLSATKENPNPQVPNRAFSGSIRKARQFHLIKHTDESISGALNKRLPYMLTWKGMKAYEIIQSIRTKLND